MKQRSRFLAVLLSLCLIVGLLPTVVLAAEEETDGDLPPVCTCEAHCAEGAVDETCLVCTVDYTACTYTAPEGPTGPEDPVCAELEGCTEGIHDPACPLYVAPGGDKNDYYEFKDVTTLDAPTDLTTLAGDGMSGTCGAAGKENSVTWQLTQNNDGSTSPTYTLTISGSGAMADYSGEKNQPWYSYANNITGVVIEDGVTTIGAHSLRQLSAINSALNIPASIETVGSCALFKANFNRYTVDESNSNLSTNDGVLFNANQTELIAYPIGSRETKYTAPATVTSVGSYAFSGAENLEKVDFSAATFLAEIGQEAFSGAKNADALFVNKDSESTITVQYQALMGMNSVVMHCDSLKIAPYAVKKTKYIDFSKVNSIDAAFDGWWADKHPFVSNEINYNVISGADIVYVANDEVAKYLTELPIVDRSTKAPDIAIVNGGTFMDNSIPTAKEDYKPSKDGVAFDSWENGGDYSITANDSHILQASIYEAKWVIEIKFNGNGATGGSMTAQQVTEGDTTTILTANGFTRTGCTFTGWNTAADGTGTPYAADATASTVPNGTTLYAQWTPNTYTIQFSGGDGASGSTNSITATYGTAVKLPANGFTMAGKKFAGWDTDSSADEVVYSDESDVVENLTAEPNGTVTLYAVWTDKQVLDPDLTDTVVAYNGKPQKFHVDDSYTVKYSQNREEVTGPTNAGIYDVEITRPEDETYAAYHGRVMGGLRIEKAPLTIKADDKSIYVGNQLPEYTYTVSGWQGSDTSDLLTGVMVTCPTVDAGKTGDYPIAVSGPQALDNYTVTYVNGTLTVSRRSSGGGGSSSQDYAVVVEDSKHGEVKSSLRYADKGDTVMLTIDPDKGYALDKLTVTDKNGDKIELTEKDDNKFTFKMPASKVAVEASFKLIETEPENPFADISKSDYFYDAVLWAVDKGITSGTSANTFSPDASCTRAQMVTFLWRANGSPKADGANPFTDVSADAYYYDAVLWAVEQGITSGTSATTFSPDATVNRGQTVTFLWRANASPVVNYAMDFTDVAADAYYAEAVRWAVSEGVTAGTGDKAFSPDADCTRAQIVTFMYRDAR